LKIGIPESGKENRIKKVALPLTRLSFSQKLDLMETLWADLARDEKKLESPAWHGAVLKEREAAYTAGKLTVSDWEQAKKRIKKDGINATEPKVVF
jgi:putative addiction module component (TIGR02574 family)